MINHYDILGVSSNANEDEIKKAFRIKAHQYHPDKNSDPSASIEFQKLQKSYEILSDKNKRFHYDVSLKRKTVGVNFSYSSSKIYVNEIHSIYVTLEEINSGVVKYVEIKSNDLCNMCNGVGVKKDKSLNKCSTCNGSGSVSVNGYLFTCGHCNGSGNFILDEDKCDFCKGKGFVPSFRIVAVTIHPGTRHGSRLIRRHEGPFVNAGSIRSDAIFEVKYKPHEIFYISSDHLFLVINITLSQALLGDSVVIPTLRGHHHTIKIDPGVLNGHTLYIKDAGLSYGNGRFGPLYVRLVYKMPALNEIEHFEIIDALKRLENPDNVPEVFADQDRFNEYIKSKEKCNDEKENCV